jgi:glycogen synthase
MKDIRIMYAAGPGDVIGTFRHWREHRDDPSQVAVTYSGQFYDVCEALGAQGFVIATHPRREIVKDGRFRIEHLGSRRDGSGRVRYQLSQLWLALHLIGLVIYHRIDVLVFSQGTCHCFPLRLLPWIGVTVIPSVHCVFYSQSTRRLSRTQRILQLLDRPFWQRSAACVLSVSPDVTRQLDALTLGRHPPVLEFLPTYRRGTFDSPSELPASQRPFRVLFAGRIEENKGVFHLLEIAKRIKAAGREEVQFDLCGTGTAQELLARQASEAGVADIFRIHGHCKRSTMQQMFRQAHALIVPTTTDFVEGLNKVVVEGVLASRPVITSSACPAIEYVRDAVIEVPPDDVNAYEAAILRLVRDEGLYRRAQVACLHLQEQFYDESRGWAAILRRALQSHRA